METLRRHGHEAHDCNGFQVLTEAHLLPGALRRNRELRFECVDTYLRVERADLPYTSRYREGQVIKLPIAHGEGNYEHFEGELDRLEANRQIVFRYVAPSGDLSDEWNFNGSARAVAGVCNPAGNVLGLMPHPERCAEQVLGNVDGLALHESVVQTSADWSERRDERRGAGEGAGGGRDARQGARPQRIRAGTSTLA